MTLTEASVPVSSSDLTSIQASVEQPVQASMPEIIPDASEQVTDDDIKDLSPNVQGTIFDPTYQVSFDSLKHTSRFKQPATQAVHPDERSQAFGPLLKSVLEDISNHAIQNEESFTWIKDDLAKIESQVMSAQIAHMRGSAQAAVGECRKEFQELNDATNAKLIALQDNFTQRLNTLETSLSDATSARLLAMEERLDKRLDVLQDSMSQIATQMSLLTEHFLGSDDGNKGEDKAEDKEDKAAEAKREKQGEKRKASSSRSHPPPPKRQAPPSSSQKYDIPSWIPLAGVRESAEPRRETPRALYPNLPIPTRARLEQFDIPLQRASIPEPTDPKILAEERKLSDLERTFRICLRYIGIDPSDWDTHFILYKQRQKDENKLVLDKDHEAMMTLDDQLTEAVRAEMASRYVIRSSR